MREMFMELLVCLLEPAAEPSAESGGPLPCGRTGNRERKEERACARCPRGAGARHRQHCSLRNIRRRDATALPSTVRSPHDLVAGELTCPARRTEGGMGPGKGDSPRAAGWRPQAVPVGRGITGIGAVPGLPFPKISPRSRWRARSRAGSPCWPSRARAGRRAGGPHRPPPRPRPRQGPCR